MEKVIINKGYTNKNFREGDNFLQEKVYTGFNHKIDYSILSAFEFVPKLIDNNEKQSK
ncbi:UNVERIFIED_CONTAM: hypothetical protein O8I53_11845 [Campylobacter lari]